MLHPSYSDLMKVVNANVEEGQDPVVNSRYSIVMATSKRARQIIARQTKAGDELRMFTVSKPLTKAVKELRDGQLKILPPQEAIAVQEEQLEELMQGVEQMQPEETAAEE